MLGVRCAVISLSQKDPVRFHTGPKKNEHHRSMCLPRIERENASGLELRVHSNHFCEADHDRNLRSLRRNTRHLRLKPTAIPNPSLPVVEPSEKRKKTTEGQTSSSHTGMTSSSSLSECCSAPLLSGAYSTRPTLPLYRNISNSKSQVVHDSPGACVPFRVWACDDQYSPLLASV